MRFNTHPNDFHDLASRTSERTYRQGRRLEGDAGAFFLSFFLPFFILLFIYIYDPGIDVFAL